MIKVLSGYEYFFHFRHLVFTLEGTMFIYTKKAPEEFFLGAFNNYRITNNLN